MRTQMYCIIVDVDSESSVWITEFSEYKLSAHVVSTDSAVVQSIHWDLHSRSWLDVDSRWL